MGIWGKLLAFCPQDPNLEYVMIDSTIIRAHVSAAGYREQTEQHCGLSKSSFTSKIHLNVDCLSNPLKRIITPGNSHDIIQADALLKGTSPSYGQADKSY